MIDAASANVAVLRNVFLENKNEVFLIDAGSGTAFTYRELEQTSLRLASFLHSLGIGKGDRVAFLLPNSIEGSFLYFACMQVGAVIVPINQRLHAEEILILIEEATPKAVFTTPFLLQEKGNMAASLGGARLITISPRFTADAQALRHGEPGAADLWKEAEKRTPISKRSFDTITDADTLALIYTSGTTSRPKGLPIAFGKIISNAHTFIAFCAIPPGVRFLGTFSQGYLGGLYNTLLFQFIAQGSVVLDAGFTADVALRFWETVQTYEVTALWLVPSMLSIILSIDRGTVGETYAPRHLKFVLVGTAPLAAVVREKFEKRYGTALYENYALSETLFITTNASSLPQVRGAGQVIPGCGIAILDEEGHPCSPGVPGEIVVQSDYMTSDYFNNPEETARAFRDGAFYTGDIGYIDSDQYLFVTDRKKDIIIRGGINISPKEIEEVIAAVEGVREVAVVGVPHALTGEEVVAVVVGEGNDPRRIQEACMQHLAPFKIPASIHFVRELPQTATGKIKKHAVRALVLDTL